MRELLYKFQGRRTVVALLQHVEGRNAQDIDLIVATRDLDRLPEVTILSRDMYYTRGRFETLQIDFLLDANPLFRHAQQNHTITQTFAEQDIRCATVEGLILLKLYVLPA